MPPNNSFRHQKYTASRPQAPYRLIAPESPGEIDSPQVAAHMRQAGETFTELGIRAVYLVHGTFAGNDASGAIRLIERLRPDLGRVLRLKTKQLVDSLAGQAGNYTSTFADRFQKLLNGRAATQVDVRLFHWSSENYHLGRAHAAVCLLDTLFARFDAGEQRVMLWGHSHGGNVFALLTNLLGSDARSRRRFFRAARSYYRNPLSRKIDLPVWERVRRRLAEPHDLGQHLDLVTFGTPIRYGWDTNGYRTLLHFVHQRPVDGTPAYLAPVPASLQDIREAAAGDYFQLLGVAGTNFPPTLFDYRTCISEWRLNGVLQSGIARTKTVQRMRIGQRVADEGRSLLVKYADDDAHLYRQILGHAIYTRLEWLPFHTQQIIDNLRAPS